MEEAVYDTLFKVSDVLHWLGKYREANALIMLGRFLRARGIHRTEQLDALVEAEEARVAEDDNDVPSPSDAEKTK